MNEVTNSDATEKFRKGADFLFGILIAVSLEKAVEGFLHVAVPSWGAEAPNGSATDHAAWPLAFFRLLVFASLIANFYFGSIKFFEETYGDKKPPTSLPGEFGWRFRVDVFSGLAHFAFFYAWSLSLTAVKEVRLPFCEVEVTPFLFMLLFVLAYDLLWLIFRRLATLRKAAAWEERDKKANGNIFNWTWKNLIIVVLAIVAAHFVDSDSRIALEVIVSAAAMVLNLWEFAGIVGQKPAAA